MIRTVGLKDLRPIWIYGLMSEYNGRTSSYTQRTSHAAYTRSVQLSTPRILNELVLRLLGLVLATSLDIVIFGLSGPSKIEPLG